MKKALDFDNGPALEYQIKGYKFKWLENLAEYLEAGKQLHNCLTQWHMFTGNVWGIQKENKYVGAVEILHGKIIQAATKYNGSIGNDQELCEVFNEWRKTFCL